MKKKICLVLVALICSVQVVRALSEYEKKIVTTTVVLEAGGENVNGRMAVLSVILNRADGKPSKMVDVVLKPKQFFCFNSLTRKRNPDYSFVIGKARRSRVWGSAYAMVERVCESPNTWPDLTGGATHYHADYVSPYWKDSLNRTVKIGSQIFYKD